jgi:pimeloyl-ACP methyl ester carboxylesterase
MNAPIQSVPLSTGLQPNPIMVKGTGAPVVYLHGLLGPEWDGFLDDLARTRRVHAPATPGSGEPDELNGFEGIYDLVLYYDDLFDRLGLEQLDLIGHSFGGMVAAEIAAAFRHRVRRLVLIDPLGLWRDDAPVEDYLLVPRQKQIALVLGDAGDPEVQAKLAMPNDPQERLREQLRRITSLASVSHFLWPIPERGLAKRLGRIRADTLILWGAEDRLVPAIYAQDFASQIARSDVEIVPGAGHSPQIQQRQVLAGRIEAFLSR